MEPGDSYYLIKAILSPNPSSLSNPSLLVLGVYGDHMFGFCRPGDYAWTHLPVDDQFRPIHDLICYKGRFLAIIQNGSVLELDFAHNHHLPKPSAKFIARIPTIVFRSFNHWRIPSIFDKKYLVELDLLQVERHNSNNDFSTIVLTTGFKLNDEADNDDDDDDDDRWVEMDNLDGHILFLGDNSSISLSAADFPGVMPNCIYFTDDNSDYYEIDPGPIDVGIFNFVDKTFARFYPMRNDTSMPPPIWIQPML